MLSWQISRVTRGKAKSFVNWHTCILSKHTHTETKEGRRRERKTAHRHTQEAAPTWLDFALIKFILINMYCFVVITHSLLHYWLARYLLTLVRIFLVTVSCHTRTNRARVYTHIRAARFMKNRKIRTIHIRCFCTWCINNITFTSSHRILQSVNTLLFVLVISLCHLFSDFPDFCNIFKNKSQAREKERNGVRGREEKPLALTQTDS